MKKTTCKNLRGACDQEITGNDANEMAENCKVHVMEKMATGDEAHSAAINDMMSLSPEDQKKFHEEFVANFDSLEDA